jgi:hypothetical protein
VRIVQVKGPEGKAEPIAQLAFDAGISEVSIRQQQTQRRGQAPVRSDVVEVSTSTPLARAFVDALTAAPFFDRQDYTILVREARSILSHEKLFNLTVPWCVPVSDVVEELWQFSHVTPGFVGRIWIASAILAWGMIQGQLLTMLAGLLFMPFLPLLLAIGVGLCTAEWRLARQGGIALLVGAGVAFLGGALVALLAEPPLHFNQFAEPLPSLLISLVVGVAAGLAVVDDAGRREMIGLAATAQIAILVVFLGIALVFGPAAGEQAVLLQRALTLLGNVVVIAGAAGVTGLLVGMRGRPLGRAAHRAAVATK